MDLMKEDMGVGMTEDNGRDKVRWRQMIHYSVSPMRATERGRRRPS